MIFNKREIIEDLIQFRIATDFCLIGTKEFPFLHSTFDEAWYTVKKIRYVDQKCNIRIVLVHSNVTEFEITKVD